MNQSKALIKKPVDKLKEIINQPTVQAQFKNALGKNSDLFVASLIDVFNTTGLIKCEPSGVIQEALKAAVLNLPISNSLGFAYLVPYSGKAQFQIGYKGLIQLAQRTGKVTILNDGLIYEGETLEQDKLTGVIIFGGSKTSDKVIGYFCYLELKNGFKKALFYTKKEVLEHAKKFSASYKSDLKYKSEKSLYFTNPDAMGLKTVWRALLSKYAPMSIEFLTIKTESEEYEKPEIVTINTEDMDNSNKEDAPVELTEEEKKAIEKQEEAPEEAPEETVPSSKKVDPFRV